MAAFFDPMNMLRNAVPLSGQSFEDNFKCYSMVFFHESKADAEHGGKIMLPPSALERLAHQNITYPMLFKLTHIGRNRITHCGVLEFSAEEGRVYVPRWMLDQLLAQDGDLIQVSYVALPLATFSKFQPQSVDFLDITNPKAVLELKLRLFACLTKGDIIKIRYNDKDYELLVQETQPDNAVSIIECDMNVDFAPPVGYREPQYMPMEATDKDSIEDEGEKEKLQRLIDENQIRTEFVPFQGEGQRLNHKSKGRKSSTETSPVQVQKHKRGIPNYNYKRGKITFVKAKSLKNTPPEERKEEGNEFTAFSGSGQQLKVPKKKNKSKRR